MNNRRVRLGLLLIGILALSGTVVVASSPAPLGLIIEPDPTPNPLSASIWTNKPTYTVGETTTVYFSINQPAYVYIYDIQPDGVVRMLFPNVYSQANYKQAGTYTLPDGGYRFRVAPPYGTEQLQIIASPVSLGLELPYGEPFPMVGPSPSAATQDIHAHIMGIIPEPTYVTAWTSFTILGYSYTPPTPTPTPSPTPPPCYSWNPFYPCPPFYGYPGASWYWDGSTWIFGVPPSGWYWYWGSDGVWHFKIRICFGC